MVRARHYCLSRHNEILEGRNVEKIVMDAYDWLARSYQEGDQIYLFGRFGCSPWFLQSIIYRFLSRGISSAGACGNDTRGVTCINH